METSNVSISCDLGSEDPILDSLKHMESIKEIKETFGAYNIVAKIENPDRDKIRETITKNIRKLEYISSTLTLIGIEGQS